MKKLLTLLTIFLLIILTVSFGATFTQKLGSDSVAISVAEDEQVNLNFVTKIGYAFKSWIIEVGGSLFSNLTSPSVSFSMPASDVIIRSDYDATYKVTFNANGGTGTMADEIIPARGTASLTPNSFTKDGSNFLGWATTDTGSVVYNDRASYEALANADLYAVWEDTGTDENTNLLAKKVQIGDYVDYNVDGKSYSNGWRVFSNDGTTVQLISAEGVEGVNLYGLNDYANLINKLNTVCEGYINDTYASNARSIGSSDVWQSATYASESDLNSEVSLGTINTSINPITVISEHNKFPYIDTCYENDVRQITEGGLQCIDLTWLASREISIANAKVYARALNNDGTIEHCKLYDFNENVDSGDSNDIRVIITLRPNVKVNGSGNGTSIDRAYGILGEIVESYTVSFNANGGTGSMNSQTFEAGVAQNLVANTFTNGSNTFAGWSTRVYGNIQYVDSQSYTATENTILYAIWKNTNESGNDPNLLTKKVQIGDYVDYTVNGKSYTGGWKVFSNNGSTVQLISAEEVEAVTLGDDGVASKSMNDYLNVVEILNSKCREYMNADYAIDGRSLGSTDAIQSISTKPNANECQSVGSINQSDYPLSGNISGFPYADTLYISDEDIINTPVEKAGVTTFPLRQTESYVWLASRDLNSEDMKFYVRYIRPAGTDGHTNLYSADETCFGDAFGIRPVITLDSSVKVDGTGDGTSLESPFGLVGATT